MNFNFYHDSIPRSRLQSCERQTITQIFYWLFALWPISEDSRMLRFFFCLFIFFTRTSNISLLYVYNSGSDDFHRCEIYLVGIPITTLYCHLFKLFEGYFFRQGLLTTVDLALTYLYIYTYITVLDDANIDSVLCKTTFVFVFRTL